MRPPRRPVVAGVVAALALAACSTEERSAPAPTFATTTTTTTLPATTTTAPPPTSTTTTTTTTTTPPRPTLPPPGAPVDRRIDLYVGGAEPEAGWLALGGWSGSDWTDDAELPAAGTAVRLTSLATGVRDTEFGGTSSACFDDTGPTIALDRPAVEPPGFGYGYIAVGGDWELHPRPTVAVDRDVPRYRALAEALLDDEPVDPSDGSITDFLLADLDADGTEEAIFVFEHVQDAASGRGEPGDFSMLVLVDTSSSTPYPLLTSVVPPLPPPTTDPETGSTLPQEPELLDRARVLDIADLNGDGRMELITRSWYFEGSAVQVTTYRDREADRVLEAGCGN